MRMSEGYLKFFSVLILFLNDIRLNFDHCVMSSNVLQVQ